MIAATYKTGIYSDWLSKTKSEKCDHAVASMLSHSIAGRQLVARTFRRAR